MSVTSGGTRILLQVLRALRDEPPYPLYGAEVAIRYCSPTNPAAQLTPATFATYLDEPHYAILTQWDEVEEEEEEEEGGGGDWVRSPCVARGDHRRLATPSAAAPTSRLARRRSRQCSCDARARRAGR